MWTFKFEASRYPTFPYFSNLKYINLRIRCRIKDIGTLVQFTNVIRGEVMAGCCEEFKRMEQYGIQMDLHEILYAKFASIRDGLCCCFKFAAPFQFDSFTRESFNQNVIGSIRSDLMQTSFRAPISPNWTRQCDRKRNIEIEIRLLYANTPIREGNFLLIG